jgi:ActR/RegA family two-component response regulator
MTGLELIEAMQKRGCKGAPAHKFILTGDASVIDMERVKKVGCNILQKPIGLDQIKSIVENIEKNTSPDRKLNDLSSLPAK